MSNLFYDACEIILNLPEELTHNRLCIYYVNALLCIINIILYMRSLNLYTIKYWAVEMQTQLLLGAH